MAGELGFDTGPFVNVAVFCENVIEDKGGVLTLIRIIDQLTLGGAGDDAPDDLPEGAGINTNLVVALKPGEARGRHKVRVTIEHPDGTLRPGPEIPVHFTAGANNGVNLNIQMQIQLSSAGLYWANVMVNDRTVTKVALEVRYEKIQPGIQSS